MSVPSPWGPEPQSSSTLRNVGAQFVGVFTHNRWLSWAVFWVGWLLLSPGTLPVGSVAFMVGYVIYRERTINLVTVCATYLGVCLYLLLGHMITDWPQEIRLWIGFGMIFSVIVLGVRYPVLGAFMLMALAAAFNGGRGGRRRW